MRIFNLTRKTWLTALLATLCAQSLKADESELTAEFWEWFGKYVDDSGEYFDPLALEELIAATIETEEVPAELQATDINEDEMYKKTGSSNRDITESVSETQETKAP